MKKNEKQNKNLEVEIINSSNLDEIPELKLEIASLYKDVYSAPPWSEYWTIESALDELNEVKEKSGFKGVIIRNKKLIGFSWGYKLPKQNTSRVDFKKINEEIIKQNLNPDACFYGADTGVKEYCRKQGIAGFLLKERTKNCKEFDFFLFRTKNPQMLRLYQNQFGNELFSFLEESSYQDGRVYIFQKKGDQK